uniref:Uncharacterized protein n=1 Tax=Paramormyrops kingsleyae TaxID=1676925 RepID=A0A3B3SMH6_9TELE
MAKSSVTIFLFAFFICIFSNLITVEGWWSQDLPIKTTDISGNKKELLGVLHNVLEKLQKKRMSNWDRKPSRLPVCSVGGLCSVKRGPRFGQLCDCPRRSKCNHFFLKCL